MISWIINSYGWKSELAKLVSLAKEKAARLYSYLTKRTYRENISAFTLFQEIPYAEFYIDDDVNELSLELKKVHSIFKNGKYYQSSKFNKDWVPNKHAFNGNIILLIDPFVASAGSLFEGPSWGSRGSNNF